MIYLINECMSLWINILINLKKYFPLFTFFKNIDANRWTLTIIIIIKMFLKCCFYHSNKQETKSDCVSSYRNSYFSDDFWDLNCELWPITNCLEYIRLIYYLWGNISLTSLIFERAIFRILTQLSLLEDKWYKMFCCQLVSMLITIFWKE